MLNIVNKQKWSRSVYVCRLTCEKSKVSWAGHGDKGGGHVGGLHPISSHRVQVRSVYIPVVVPPEKSG